MTTSSFSGNYDSPATVISVNAGGLNQIYQQAQKVQTSIGDSLKKINDTLSNLKLSWVGSSATEAQRLTDAWNKAMVDLFGQNNDQEWGTLYRLLLALNMTSVNYSQTEAGLAEMWRQIMDELDSSLSSTGSGSDSQGSSYKPIAETY